MRPTALILAALIAFWASTALAQDITLPGLTFPAPGTFCGPMQLCPPDTVPPTVPSTGGA